MESKIKKILCPIDFTTASINAIEYAAKLSKRLNASLTLWNTCEISIMDEMSSQENSPNSIEYKQEILSEILQDWCEDIKEEFNIPCGYIVPSRIENLETTLAHYANGENFDLMVAGTNGVDSMYQLFFGIDSYQIIKEVECPLLIIPEGYVLKKLESIVFATDFTLNDAHLAKRLLQAFETKINFLNLCAKENSIDQGVLKSFKEVVEIELKNKNMLNYDCVNYKDDLIFLIEILKVKKADMFVLSAELRNWFEGFFYNTFIKKLILRTQVPTLIFK